MTRVLLVSPRLGDGQTHLTAYRPRLADDYPGVSWEDATGQHHRPTSIGIMVVLADPSDADLALIRADANYFVIAVEGDGTRPSRPAGNALRNWLVDRGITVAQLQAWFGTNIDDRTKPEIITILRERLRALADA